MEKKTFDAVKMVREIRDRTAEEMKDMSPEERMDYYRTKAKAVHRELDRAHSGKGREKTT
jgi:hypothetical protein